MQRVAAAILEHELGADGEQRHGRADQHLARAGAVGDTRADVDREAGQVVAPLLAVAGVDAGAHVEAGAARFGDDLPRAAHGALDDVEARQQAVAAGLHDAAAGALDQAARGADTGGFVDGKGNSVDSMGDEQRRIVMNSVAKTRATNGQGRVANTWPQSQANYRAGILKTEPMSLTPGHPLSTAAVMRRHIATAMSGAQLARRLHDRYQVRARWLRARRILASRSGGPARPLLLAILAGLLGAVPAPAAQIVFVDAAGGCAGNAPCFTTIQAGVNNAGPGSATLFIFPGTYTESVNLDLMGSAIGGTPDDIALLNSTFLTIFAASAPDEAASAMRAPLLADGPARVEAARAHVDAVLGRMRHLVPAGAALAAHESGASLSGVSTLPAVDIVSPGGAAIFHTGTFPGSVGLFGLNVQSASAEGISLPDVAGAIDAFVVVADDSLLDGMVLNTAEDLMVIGASASGNGGYGLDASAGMEMELINVIANANGADGMRLLAGEQLTIFSLSSESSPFAVGLADFPLTSANDNDGAGVMARSSDGIGLLAGLDLGALTDPPLELNRNGTTGAELAADEAVTIIRAQANGNATGLLIMAQDNVFVLASSADGNTAGAGMVIWSDGADEIDSGLLPAAVNVYASTASGNTGAGFDLTTPNGGVQFLGNAAVGNTDGLRVNQLLPGALAEATGNILCNNSAAGARLLANVTLSSGGNWWGSATGPFHAVHNPGGLGNQVVDGTNGGGAGTVAFTPFIDTMTASANGPIVDFQFSGGDGTVFLGLPQVLAAILYPLTPPDPPFTLTTDNGILIGSTEKGTTVHEAINQPGGIVRVRLQAGSGGLATVTLAGPCGLDGSVVASVPSAAAPALGAPGLIALALVLGALGLRHRSRD